MHLHAIAYYLISINVVAAYIFWLDWLYKRKQLGLGSIPDGILYVLGFMGGAFGIAIMQPLIMHNLYRPKFSARIRLYMVMHLSLLAMSFNTFQYVGA